MLILLRFAQTDFADWVAGDYLIWFYVLGDNRLSSDDCILSNRYSRHYHRPYAYEGTVFDGDLFGNQLKRGVVEVVCSRAKVGFLGNRGPFHNNDCSKRVGIRSFSEASTVMHGQMPGDLNTGLRMDEWRSRDSGSVNSQDNQPNRIKKLWCP